MTTQARAEQADPSPPPTAREGQADKHAGEAELSERRKGTVDNPVDKIIKKISSKLLRRAFWIPIYCHQDQNRNIFKNFFKKVLRFQKSVSILWYNHTGELKCKHKFIVRQ